MGAPLPGFHLTKKRAVAAEWVVSPVLEQAHCFRADLPLGGVGPGPPHIHVLAHFIDDGGRIVLLFLGGEALPLVEHHLGLLPSLFLLPLLRLWNRRDELGPPPSVQDLLSRLPLGVQLPVPLWVLVGRVQDGVVEEWVRQVDTPPEQDSCRPVLECQTFGTYPIRYGHSPAASG